MFSNLRQSTSTHGALKETQQEDHRSVIKVFSREESLLKDLLQQNKNAPITPEKDIGKKIILQTPKEDKLKGKKQFETTPQKSEYITPTKKLDFDQSNKLKSKVFGGDLDDEDRRQTACTAKRNQESTEETESPVKPKKLTAFETSDDIFSPLTEQFAKQCAIRKSTQHKQLHSSIFDQVDSKKLKPQGEVTKRNNKSSIFGEEDDTDSQLKTLISECAEHRNTSRIFTDGDCSSGTRRMIKQPAGGYSSISLG